jgi:hypothetical protein
LEICWRFRSQFWSSFQSATWRNLFSSSKILFLIKAYNLHFRW